MNTITNAFAQVNKFTGAVGAVIFLDKSIEKPEPVEDVIFVSLPDGVVVEEAIASWRYLGEQWVEIGSTPGESYDYDVESGAWVFNLTRARATKRAEVKRDRDEFEFGGFDWNGYRFDSNQISQQRIQGAAQMAMLAQAAGQPFSIRWTLANDLAVELTGEQMLVVGMTMAAHIGAAHEKSRLLKAQIDAAQTVEDVLAVSW